MPLAKLSEEASVLDETLPPFWRLEPGAHVNLIAYLDKDRPLSEPKWVKTGDVQDWLKDMFGGRFWVAGEAVGWEKKIEVRYPDPVRSLLSWFSSVHHSRCFRPLPFRMSCQDGHQTLPWESHQSALAS